ncbi:MAG: SUMF1/EgtB/PvdO family nonheme iron enzyme [Mariniblastus sp.]
MAKHPNYEILETLGRGENSIVYRAWDVALGRDVAIKEFTSEAGSDGGQSDVQRIGQFLQEASFLAQFEHENGLRIHTVDQDRGWIVMELMKGSLTNQIAAQPMPADTVRSVLRQMLNALDFLHQKDKVHGAVRPSNILINENGAVRLSDFEASSRDGELRVPTGSKKYLAPELIRSEFGEFGPAVDLYCLGFTALELLTGKKFDSLFPGTGEGAIDADVAWLRWHSSDEAMRPVAEIAPDVPSDLASVIDQLLKKTVGDRPHDAAEVLKLLNDAPLVPVQVIESQKKTKSTKQTDLQAILPSKAVKLREAKPRKKAARTKQSTSSTASKDRLNETLSKPYVLWPICIGIIVAALFVGLQLRGDRTEKPVAKVNPVEPISEVQPLPVELRVLPSRSAAKLLIGGEPREFADLRLKPGKHEIVVEKDGFELYRRSLEIDVDNTTFEIELAAKKEAIAKVDGEIDKPTPVEPKLIDLRIAVTPANAKLIMDGRPLELRNGVIQIDPKQITRLELLAEAKGYERLDSRWSLEELAAENYDLQLSLKKLSGPQLKIAGLTWPKSLVPKADSETDTETGLPLRAFVRSLQDSSPLEVALVKSGSYQFGVTEGPTRTWELPGETVVVEYPFYIGIDEVSNAQYLTFINEAISANPANATESDLPISNLTVRQAADFCDWAGGRLPTEVEWECAVRGLQDSGYPLPWGDGNLNQDQCRLFRGESAENSGPEEIGKLLRGANKLGLLNTIGNLAEWCDNQLGQNQFVTKGCSFRIPPGDHVRVTWRNATKWDGGNDIGMRLMVPVVKKQQPSSALSFVAPTNIETVLVSTGKEEQGSQTTQATYVKTIKEIADEFTAPAELVIDSGGFIDEVTDVSFSPNGKQIAVGGGKVVRIWEVGSGKLLETLRGDRSRTSYGNVNAVAWSPDGKFLLVGVSDYREHGNIRVYSTEDFGEIAEVIAGHTAPCRKLCFSRDGKQLVSVDSDGLILVRDWETRTVQHRIAARDRDKPIFDLMKFPTNEPYMLGIDFEGPQVFSALNGQRIGARDEMPSQIRGWLVDIFNDLVKFPYNTKKQPRVLDFRMEEGRWAGAGNAIVEGRSRFWVRVWKSRDPVSTASLVTELAGYGKHRWSITSISLQPNGPLVASGDKFGEVHVWDSQTGEQKFVFSGQGKPIYEVAFDEGSSRLAFGVKPHSPKQWKRNSYGTATRVLDLRQRTIADVDSLGKLQLLNERPSFGNSNVTVRKQDAYYFVELMRGMLNQSKYRISSGRNPTVFTLLDQPKLGVQKPVLFGDNEGLFAMWDSAGDELKRAFIGHGSLVSAISPASNGKMVATSSTDRTIRLWSLEDYVSTGIFDFKFENSAVREVIPGTSSAKAGVQVGDRIVSIDGKSLAEMFDLMLLGKFDYKPGQVVPVQMKRGEQKFDYEMKMANGYDFSEPILNFYMGDNGQWIIWHPQGYYDASPGADRLIGWHINRGHDKEAKFFEVQQFKSKLYRPDVIDGILETGSLKQALSQLKVKRPNDEDIDFRKEKIIAEYHPPSVKITSPDNGWQTKTAKVTVKGEANSVNGLPLTALTLLHNGSVAKVFRPTQVNQLAMKIEFEIELEAGFNDLVLIAANAKSSSQGEHIVVDLSRPREIRRPNAMVLAIGVSEFDSSLTQIPNAAKDAQAFSNAMQEYKNGRLYGNVTTKLLSGKVTNNQILEGFQWLSDNTKSGDVAIVFVASHAIVDRRDNFFIAATNSVESQSRSTAVSWRDLMDTLQLDLPDCKRMVFLDLEPTSSAIKPGMRNPLLDLAAPEMGTIFLSSNTLQQKTVQVAGAEKGAFLRAVLETVGNRRFDTFPSSGDSLLNPTELAAGVMARVKDITRDKQQPVFFSPEHAKLANILELRN